MWSSRTRRRFVAALAVAALGSLGVGCSDNRSALAPKLPPTVHDPSTTVAELDPTVGSVDPGTDAGDRADGGDQTADAGGDNGAGDNGASGNGATGNGATGNGATGNKPGRSTRPAANQPSNTPDSTVAPLRVGASGEAVQNLQVGLNKLGYLPGRSDGKYDRPTQAAVDQFVADYGVTPTRPGADAVVQQAIAAAVGRAPKCNRGAIIGRTAPQAGLQWDAKPTCTFGWSILIEHSTTSGQPGVAHLYRVRTDGWVEVKNAAAYAVHLGLAADSPLAARRFAQVFGHAGWPYRVRSADEAMAFLVQAAQTQPIEAAQEQAAMWLDPAGLEEWTRWVVNLHAAGTPGACTRGGALRGFTCSWTAESTTFTVSFDAKLTKATMSS